ncbi:Mpo1-like protein, partial [Herbaspirillum sp. B65]|uniref:Mpo1-like protein n=1 Tax=Herbaspirillum sp. B65 TaxID=137708 RepID=UPI0005C978EC
PPLDGLPVSAVVFVLAWIGQFIGHRIEGKKPSFFEDLRFLLVGPLFVLAFLYRRWNISY